MKPLLSRRQFLASTALSGAALVAGGTWGRAADAVAPAVKLSNDRTVLDVSLNGKAFAVYNYSSDDAGLYRPYFHPLFGPKDQAITQNGEFPGTLRGHYWHRGLFVAHQKVNGVSFWEERRADCGRIVHLQFDEFTSGEKGRFVERLAWRDLGGRDLLREARIVQVSSVDAERHALDISIQLRPVAGEVTFAQTPYNLLACRVANSMCRVEEKRQYSQRYGGLVDFEPAGRGGHLLNSEGSVDDACRGARARWCDFSGPLRDGTVAGVAILDHPSNPRHPIPWHNWNNMTFTASLTYHEPLALKQGDELRLAFRVVVHAGRPEDARLEEAWKAFAQVKPLFA